jgi:tRNA 2-thiouridine synthesizing protein A
MASEEALRRRVEKRYGLGGALRTGKAMPMIDETLDARGLKCPLPVLLAKKALKRAPKGSLLEVLATDRGVDADIIDLCELTGAVLVDWSFDDGVYRFVLRSAV